MNKERALVRRIMLATGGVDALYDQIAKALGYKANISWLLYALDDGEPHSQKQLYEEWLIPKTTLNTVVKECEAAGYITLETMAGHRREKNICLTETGREYAREALDEIYRAEEEAIAATLCTEEFVVLLETFFKKLKTSFGEIITEHGEKNKS